MADVYYATGRRKTSAARVFLKKGTGQLTVNGKKLEEYVFEPTCRQIIMQPFEVTNTTGQWDLQVTVKGGGISGQAGAIRHGISRALSGANTELRPALKKAGLMTRDPRMVERKKYGLHKARKSTQFSKR